MPVGDARYRPVEIVANCIPLNDLSTRGFSGVMVGHLFVPALDSETKRPASLSPLVIDSLLRRQMGFDGLVFTDALEMKGVADNENMVVNAVLAGNDILLKPENPLSQVKLLINAVKLGYRAAAGDRRPVFADFALQVLSGAQQAQTRYYPQHHKSAAYCRYRIPEPQA